MSNNTLEQIAGNLTDDQIAKLLGNPNLDLKRLDPEELMAVLHSAD